MTSLDSIAPPIARTIINQFGKRAVLRKVDQVGYDSAQGAPIVDITDYDVKLAPDKPAGRALAAENESMKTPGVWLMAGLGAPVTPTNKDQLVIDGIVLPILSAEPTYSGDSIAVWALTVRNTGTA